MVDPYIEKADIEARIGASAVQRILDHDNDGVADTDAIDRCIADASSKVAGYMNGPFDLDTIDPSTANEVKRLTLDVAIARLSIDFPEVTRKDGYALMEMADRDLKSLRMGRTQLDTKDPPEPGDTGGVVVSGGSTRSYL